MHGGDIGLGAVARALEHAFEARDRTDDKADVLSAAAFEDAGSHAGHSSVSAGDGSCERSSSEDEGSKSHGFDLRETKLNKAEGQEGKAVSKTRHVRKSVAETSCLWHECRET